MIVNPQIRRTTWREFTTGVALAVIYTTALALFGMHAWFWQASMLIMASGLVYLAAESAVKSWNRKRN